MSKGLNTYLRGEKMDCLLDNPFMTCTYSHVAVDQGQPDHRDDTASQCLGPVGLSRQL